MVRRVLCMAVVACVFGLGRRAVGEDVYYYLALKDIKITRGEVPTAAGEPAAEQIPWRRRGVRADFMQPYAVADGGAEVYVVPEDDATRSRGASPATNMTGAHVAIRAAKGEAIAGRLYVPKADWSGMVRVDFTVAQPPADQAAAREDFLHAKERHYGRLLDLGIPGAAWFRRQAREARFASDAGARVGAAAARAKELAKEEAKRVAEEERAVEAAAAKAKELQAKAAETERRAKDAEARAKTAPAAEAAARAAELAEARRAVAQAQTLAAEAELRLAEARARAAEAQRQRAAARAAEVRSLERPGEAAAARGAPAPESELQRTYSLFTGGRAVSENLQLDRQLRVLPATDETVPVASIEGISTTPMDWKKLVAGLAPKKDPLASYVPADQHALFFPTFQAMLDLTDEADARGTPVLHLLEPRAEDALTRDRYGRQLCISPTVLSRILGPGLVASVAFTGSDPYLRTGSDVAVLFEAKDVASLRASIAVRQQAAATAAGAAVVGAAVQGVPYAGVVTPDRRICSYMAVIDRVVVVTNSLAQLERIVQAARGQLPAMASQDEYTFFRDRYKLGDADETALLVLSDAAIRRWCGPRWRIADSRRTRAAAALAEIQARHLDELAAGRARNSALAPEESIAGAGEVRVTPDGVISSVNGTLEFLTPIVEMPLEKVTPQEARAYEWFRQRYQSNWRQYFDPIAVRFSVGAGRLAVDLTVRPLILGSDYREMMGVAGKGGIAPDSGDPHSESLLHFVTAIDADSSRVRGVSNFAMGMAPGLGEHGLKWLGRWLGVYCDDDPFWKELEAAAGRGGREGEDFMSKNFARLPVAVAVECTDGLRLAAFLAAGRAFIDQTAPGMTAWETLQHNGRAYVKVAPSQKARGEGAGGPPANLAVYYAGGPGSLTVTLSEAMMKRALDRASARDKARAGGKEAAPAGEPWLGGNLCLQVGSSAFTIAQALLSEDITVQLQRQAWGNIVILNEWRRRYGAQDPVAFHQRFWQVKLVCPAGGAYAWNEEFQAMESTVLGHPGRPRAARALPSPVEGVTRANLGVTFEADGLRARAELKRAAK